MSILRIDPETEGKRDRLRSELVGTYALIDVKNNNETLTYLIVRASGNSHIKFTSIYPTGEVSNGWIYSLYSEGEAILADLKRPGVVKVLDSIPDFFKFIESEAKGGGDE